MCTAIKSVAHELEKSWREIVRRAEAAADVRTPQAELALLLLDPLAERRPRRRRRHPLSFLGRRHTCRASPWLARDGERNRTRRRWRWRVRMHVSGTAMSCRRRHRDEHSRWEELIKHGRGQVSQPIHEGHLLGTVRCMRLRLRRGARYSVRARSLRRRRLLVRLRFSRLLWTLSRHLGRQPHQMH